MVMMHECFFGIRGHSGEIAGEKKCKTSFSPSWVFLYSRYSLKKWWCKVFWLLWIGRARHPGPFSGYDS